MQKYLAIIAITLAILNSAHANVLLTDFGSSATSVEDTFTSIPYSLNTSSTQFSSITDAAGNQITWLFDSPLVFSNINTQNLFLNFSLSGTNPNSYFHIDLYSNSYDYYTFTGTTTSASSSPSDVALSFHSLTGSAFSSFVAAALFFDGTGSAITSMTVYNLNYSTVPEPSAYVLMALGGLVVLFAARRRKA